MKENIRRRLHSDLDKGEGTVKYTLSGDGAGTVFTIDETTGDIHAIRSLDREEKPFYTLRAQAVDIETRKPLEPESEFIIKVQDINDNEPKFLDGPYIASVPEMSPVGCSSSSGDKRDLANSVCKQYADGAKIVKKIIEQLKFGKITIAMED
ncbi:hypothetical protein MJT46_012078 [Ovis ammon polii x Ovis aries]|nr:hypothetical protein MJT46_012078 [Ovis ammon polii x Ovis aries]